MFRESSDATVPRIELDPATEWGSRLNCTKESTEMDFLKGCAGTRADEGKREGEVSDPA